MSKDHGFDSAFKVKMFAHWRPLLQRAATRLGMTPSQYVRGAILEALERDGFDGTLPITDPETKRQTEAARAALTSRFPNGEAA